MKEKNDYVRISPVKQKENLSDEFGLNEHFFWQSKQYKSKQKKKKRRKNKEKRAKERLHPRRISHSTAMRDTVVATQ